MSPEPRDGGPGLTALTSLRRFARPRAAEEQCELCAKALPAEHDHLVEPSTRQLVCACEACAILFSNQAAAKYRRVPRRVRFLPDFVLPDTAWQGLNLPIDLAFFQRSTAAGGVLALYPSPAGVTQASVPPDAWQALAEDNPVLHDLEPDVEALLVNRVAGARECFRAGIDQCYRLVGILRTHWRGLSGGAEVWGEIRKFFAGLKERSSR
jgi:hypothetical protein